MISQNGSGHALPTGSVAELPVQGGVYRLRALEKHPQLVHGITTRTTPDGGDWNLSARRGTPQHPPDPAVAFANRQKLANALGIELDTMVGCQQIHGSEVAVVSKEDAGRGMKPGSPAVEGVDAMVTATPGLSLMVLAADCPPVFLYDPTQNVVGIAHSGWKGTVDHIAGKVVESMVRDFSSQPGDLHAVIGPGIGPCCYSVREDVVGRVEEAFSDVWQPNGSLTLLERRGGLVHFNLWAAIRCSLLEADVRAENISTEAVCTAHNTDTFYSHRGEAGQCGLFGAVIGLRDG